MKNKIYFITFGSHNNYVEAGIRLIEQAKELKILLIKIKALLNLNIYLKLIIH
jgi:hypothetical protein